MKVRSPIVLLVVTTLFGLFSIVGNNVFSASEPQKIKVASPQGLTAMDVATRSIQRCSWYDRGTYFVISNDCIEKGIYPNVSLKTLGDSLIPMIQDVTDIYSIDEKQFTYAGTDLIYTEHFQSVIDAWEDGSFFEDNQLGGGYMMIPTALIAWHHAQNRSFYASVRDTSGYGTCRKTNYDVAMRELDGYVLEPDQLLNMNKLIAYKPGYCTGGSHYMFYQGACGGSTQLFWNGLLNPYLEVTKRYAHGQRYEGFYGSTIMGDDASMYERGKQLELKNSGQKDLYFGTIKRPSDGNTVLLSIYPSKTSNTVMVQKQQTGKRSAVVTNTVFDEAGGVIYEKDWISNYRGINTDTDTD